MYWRGIAYKAMKEPVKSEPDWELRIEAVLKIVQDAIVTNQTEEAKSKLAGITLECQPGSKFSQEIGDLYFKLNCPIMAGLYWYLLDNKNEQMLDTCKAFENSLGNNPFWINHFFVYSKYLTLSSTAGAQLHDLKEELKVLEKRNQYPHSRKVSGGTLKDRLGLLGCGIIATIILFIFIQGIIFIGTWFRQ